MSNKKHKLKYNKSMDEQIEQLQSLIDNAKKIVFFGGAGVSTESGLKDFRSEDGLKNVKNEFNLPYETILSNTFFNTNPTKFYKFYRSFMLVNGIKPNAAHYYLAKKEKEKDITIITQNIDGLHQEAGSKNVIELHGSIHRNYCTRCARFYSLETIKMMDLVPICPKCGGIIKPDVVLYEEPLNQMSLYKAVEALMSADLLIIAGTSLNVYPAASLINYFSGNNIVIINKDKIQPYRQVKLEINGKIGEVFSQLK